MTRTAAVLGVLASVIVLAAAVIFHGLYWYSLDAPAAVGMEVIDSDKNVVGQWTAPALAQVDALPDAEAIQLGRRLLNDTARLLPDNVGNGLNCNSCHMGDGKHALRNHYINASASYPRYMPRPGKDITLVERITGCFARSMNGTPLPADDNAMQAMLAYMRWLGSGIPHGATVAGVTAGKIDTGLVADPQRGSQLYAAQCAACHGDNGQRMRDARGETLFPALWGDDAFNLGAGMARLYKAAAFVKYNMPPAANTLPPYGQMVMPDQDALDVSAYFIPQPRPDFAGKHTDWPRDPKPRDARY